MGNNRVDYIVNADREHDAQYPDLELQHTVLIICLWQLYSRFNKCGSSAATEGKKADMLEKDTGLVRIT